jgi:hypothetical protein
MSGDSWYKEVSDTAEVMQGDLLVGCPIPYPNRAVYDAILNENTSVLDDPLEVKEANLVILSQACDLVNNKVDTVVLCAYWPLSHLVKNDSYYQASGAKESLRQGKEPAHHLIHKYESESIQLDYSVVDFRQIYTLPKDYLARVVSEKKFRLRLLSPYREHLSQSFARYFMRVGLPINIPREEIKACK